MDLNNFAVILVATLNPNTQKVSEEQLKRLEASNYPEYLQALASVLCNPSKPQLSGRVAGLILKNAFFDDKSDVARIRKYRTWTEQVSDQLKQYVRECVLRALLLPDEESRKSASQVVGALGVLELEGRRWPDLIGSLCTNATSPQLSDEIKVNSLDSIGYLCENLNPALVDPQMTNALLTAIVDNMKAAKPDHIRVASVRALYNTLEFASENMKRDHERDFIVGNICECARANSMDIRCSAFDCMRKLAEEYYQLLSIQYMDAFFHLTFSAVKGAAAAPSQSDAEKVALHAIEFWSTLCETEYDMSLEEDDARANGLDLAPERVSKKFINRAMPVLVDLITSVCLIKQSAELTDDEDDWNLAMSGGTLLGLIAICERNSILAAVMPFVQKNLPLLGEANWRQREAGLMAFGKCLDGPDSQDLTPFIREGLDFFLSLLDPSKEAVPQVRDTAAWVIGCVCELHVEAIIEYLPRIMGTLVQGLNDPISIVASKNAEAIKKLAIAFSEFSFHPTNPLSRFLPVLLPKLVETTQRPDWEEGELRGNCFEAIDALVENCAQDGLPIVASLLEEIIRRLTIALSAKAENQAQREEVNGMIDNCCGTLLVIIHKLKSQIQPHAETIMTLLIRILDNVHSGYALMDTQLVVGAVATALGLGFRKYYKFILPYIKRGLENADDYQVCQTATELVADVARAVQETVFDDTPWLVQFLLRNLANEDLNRVVKPPTISAFGDLALALNEKFEPFADPVLAVLDKAAMIVVPKDDQDMIEYLNEIRENILETYTAILQALGSQAALRVFPRRLDLMLNFIVAITRELNEPDSNVTDAVVKGAVGLLGDICKVLGPEARHKVRTGAVMFNQLVKTCGESEDQEMVEVASYCMRQMEGR